MPSLDKLNYLFVNNGIEILDCDVVEELALIEIDYDENLLKVLIDVMIAAEESIRVRFPLGDIEKTGENYTWYLPSMMVDVGRGHIDLKSETTDEVLTVLKTIIGIKFLMQTENKYCNLDISSYSDIIAGLLNVRLLEGKK